MRLNRKFIISIVLIAAGMTLLGVAYAKNQDYQWEAGTIRIEDQPRSMFPQLANIGVEQALQLAESQVGCNALAIRLDKEQGWLVYTAEIASPENSIVEVIVDAGKNIHR